MKGQTRKVENQKRLKLNLGNDTMVNWPILKFYFTTFWISLNSQLVNAFVNNVCHCSEYMFQVFSILDLNFHIFVSPFLYNAVKSRRCCAQKTSPLPDVIKIMLWLTGYEIHWKNASQRKGYFFVFIWCCSGRWL